VGGFGWGWGWGLPRTRTVIINNGGGGYGGPPGGPPPPDRRDSGSGCLAVVLAVALVLLILGFFLVVAGSFDGGGSVSASTVEREPLPAGSVQETGYYTDELGWIVNEGEMLSGMRAFYKETGVQPYLYLTETVNGSFDPSSQEMGEFSERLYDQLFTDEAHFLVVYQEAGGPYMVGYTAGSQAKSIMDDEAVGIFRDCLDRYNSSDLTDEAYFGTVFRETGERIMTVTKSPWPVVAGIFGAIVLAAVLFTWWKKAKEQKAKEAQQVQEMLNTPLETFGDTDAEDLAAKYQKEAAPPEDTDGGGQNQS